MKKLISEILKEASEAKTKEEKLEILRTNSSVPLNNILECVFSPHIKFLLPEDSPKYKANDPSHSHEKLYFEVRKLYLFVEGGNPNLKQSRREELFVQFLESIHCDDAAMMLHVKNKKLPWSGITPDVVKELYPDMDVVDAPFEVTHPIVNKNTETKKAHYRAKLTVEQVVVIKDKLKNGVPVPVVAEEFGMSNNTINDIKRGYSWKNV